MGNSLAPLQPISFKFLLKKFIVQGVLCQFLFISLALADSHGISSQLLLFQFLRFVVERYIFMILPTDQDRILQAMRIETSTSNLEGGVAEAPRTNLLDISIKCNFFHILDLSAGECIKVAELS